MEIDKAPILEPVQDPEETQVQIPTPTVANLLSNLREAAVRQSKVSGPIEIEVRGKVRYREAADGGVELNTLSDGLAKSLQNRFAQPPISRAIAERQPAIASVKLQGQEELRVERKGVVLNQLKGYQPYEQLQSFAHETMAQPLSVKELEPGETVFSAERSTVGQKWTNERFSEKASRVAEDVGTIRDLRIASSATQLLQKFGTYQGKGLFSLATRGYVIEGQGRELAIKSTNGETVFKAYKSPLGVKLVVLSRLNADQQRDFLVAQRFIKAYGINAFSENVMERSQQLGQLTPRSEAKYLDQVNALRISTVARRYLDLEGAKPDENQRRAIDGPLYRIEESESGLKVTAKRADGKEQTIIEKDNSKLTVNLTADDITQFAALAKDLSGPIRVQPQPVAKPLRNPIQSAQIQL